MAVVNPVLQLYEAQFNDKEFTSANHLSKSLLTQGSWLSTFVTHAYGSSANYGNRNFPLSFITEGMGSVERIGSTDLSYKMAILGRPKKTATVSTNIYASTDTPGRGRTKFKVVFSDRWFYKSQSIFSASRLECRVQSDPKSVAGGWEYELKMMDPSISAFVPVADLTAGAVWGGSLAKVAKERSRGVESRSYSPFAVQNQLSVVRDTYNIAGNIKNKVMVLEIKANGQTFKYWTQWEMFQRQLQFKEKLEFDLWWSTYNKDGNGVIHVDDEDNGEVVPSGAGLLQQIPNQDSYSILTTTKLTSLITDIFFNAADADAIDVEVYTGTGGLREANDAMTAAARGFTLVDNKYVKDSKQSQEGHGSRLMFGAYYNVYQHIDGHTVTFKKLPMMDRGIIADSSPRHPITNLPIESYNMYCVDNSMYDGVRNLKYVSESGREEITKMVPGMAPAPDGYTDSLFASSDIDASSIQWMKTQGIACMRPTNCFKLNNGIAG